MPPKHSVNLDILRGLLALIVVIAHLNAFPTHFDKNFGKLFSVYYNFPGGISVLGFFILSGYVIGLNHPELSDKKMIKSYIKKRLIRIVPIYFVAIIFTALITWGDYSWKLILSNLFFVSVPLGNILDEAFPLWSLHYELFCYTLFIFVSYFKLGLARTLKVLLIVTVILFLFFHKVRVHPLFITYLIGFIFWITGAMLAQIKTFPYWNISASRMISIFLLMFCLQNLNPYGPILKVLHFSTVDYSGYIWYQAKILYPDLFFYPLTILFILSLTHSYSKTYKFLIYFLFIAATLRLFMLVRVYGFNYLIQEHYVIPVTVLIISILFWLLNFQINGKAKKIIKSLASLSAISYAMYIIHLPIMNLFGKIVTTSIFYFIIKFIAFWVVLFIVCYFLELKFQPFIKKLFRGKSTANTSVKVRAD